VTAGFLISFLADGYGRVFKNDVQPIIYFSSSAVVCCNARIIVAKL